jgi:hypothetical protein
MEIVFHFENDAYPLMDMHSTDENLWDNIIWTYNPNDYKIQTYHTQKRYQVGNVYKGEGNKFYPLAGPELPARKIVGFTPSYEQVRESGIDLTTVPIFQLHQVGNVIFGIDKDTRTVYKWIEREGRLTGWYKIADIPNNITIQIFVTLIYSWGGPIQVID